MGGFPVASLWVICLIMQFTVNPLQGYFGTTTQLAESRANPAGIRTQLAGNRAEVDGNVMLLAKNIPSAENRALWHRLLEPENRA